VLLLSPVLSLLSPLLSLLMMLLLSRLLLSLLLLLRGGVLHRAGQRDFAWRDDLKDWRSEGKACQA
jgi:hypothetical protein